MGTHPDHHSEEPDKGVARLLRDGQREPLARARETLKDRLLQQMRHEVLEDLQDTDRVVRESLEEMTAEGEVLREAGDVLKARLVERLYQRALDEAGREVPQETERLVQEALADAAGQDAVNGVRETLKARLLDDIRRQAIEELSREDLPPSLGVAEDEALAGVKEAIKEHLFEAVRRQAVEELSREALPDVERLAHEALAGTAGDALQGVQQAFKEHLLEDLQQQAVEQVRRETKPERMAREAFEGTAGDALAGVKEAFKARLLDKLLQDAISEIGDEVSVAPDPFEVAPEAYPTDEVTKTPEEEAPSLIDMHFWEEEDGHLEEILDPAEDLDAPDDGDAGDEKAAGFFLSNETSASGTDFVDASSDEQDPADATTFDVDGDGSLYLLDQEDGDGRDFEEALEEAGDEAAPTYENGEAAAPEAPNGDVVYYLYGILSGEEAAEGAILPESGIDPDFPLYILSDGNIHAVVSRVALQDFGEAALAVHLKDAGWTEAHNLTHDALVEEISRNGTFLPVPFCTVYHSEDQVRRMLSEIIHIDELERLAGKHQWQLEVHRNRETLHQRVVENSDTVQELMGEIRSKPKGSAGAIKKKMVATIQEEMALVTDNCTKDVHERLLSFAADAELGTPGESGKSEKGESILAVTYLVHEDRVLDFQDAIESLKHEYGELGFCVEVFGPSPPTLFSRFQPAETPEDGTA